MRFEEFKLERFFAIHEFNVKCSISSSDCETLKVAELLDKGDHVIVIKPTYQSLREGPRVLGCDVSDLPIILQDGKWKIELEMLKS